MSTNSSKRRRTSAVLAATVAMLTAGMMAASPAAASGTYSGRAYVYGAGAFQDDWGDEGILSTSTHTSSNATCLWQKILWADGAIERDGTTFDAADIDGVFGPNTEAATRHWQRTFGLDDDGSVGKDTFGSADSGLADENGDQAVDHFYGLVHTISVTRDSEGRYHFYDGDGSARIAGYNYRSCS